ncbi:MAG: hypothetical protein V4692_14730 [Bdellovibrionota bacterium]
MIRIFVSVMVLFAGMSVGFAQEEDSTLTYDIGLSTGRVNDVSYTEANLGFNYKFLDYVAWRNALFGRFASGADSVYGIDTSLRGMISFGDRQMGLSAFLGPGFRFVTKGDNAPFAEGGVVLNAAGISIGAGAKSIFNSAVRNGAQNDSQIFLILAGGGAL